MRLYKSYMFRSKDPAIDAFRTLRDDSGLSMKNVQEASGVNVNTIRGWERGKTQRPQFATLWAAAAVCGATGIKRGKDGRPYFEYMRKPALKLVHGGGK